MQSPPGAKIALNLLNNAFPTQQVSEEKTRPRIGSRLVYAKAGAKEGVKAFLAAAKRAPRDLNEFALIHALD